MASGKARQGQGQARQSRGKVREGKARPGKQVVNEVSVLVAT